MMVDNMVDTNPAKYLFQKRRVFYYSRHIPTDLREHYKTRRLVFSLKTKSQSTAEKHRDPYLKGLMITGQHCVYLNSIFRSASFLPFTSRHRLTPCFQFVGGKVFINLGVSHLTVVMAVVRSH